MGLETYKQILKIVPNQRAVTASGYAMSKHGQKAQQLEAGGYIEKPFTLENIGLAVRAEFDQKS
jgi:two-component system cell cycle sensor histidine kinase/response regulator CckA